MDDSQYTLKRFSKPQHGVKRIYINHEDVDADVAICPSYNGYWNLEYKFQSLVDFGYVYHHAVLGKCKKDAEDMATYLADLAIREYLDLDEDINIHQITFEELWKNAL